MLARDSLLLSTGSVKAGAIIADPPWQFDNRTGKAAPEHKRLHRYPTMTLQEIKALGIDGTVSIELEYSPEPAKIVDWVREAYTATDRLMQQVGLRG